MATRARVTRVTSESGDHGAIEVEITIKRCHTSMPIFGDPNVEDVPQDVRYALLEWLGGAE